MAEKIRELLKARGATVLPGTERDVADVLARKQLVQLLAAIYPTYNEFLRVLLDPERQAPVPPPAGSDTETQQALDALCAAGYLQRIGAAYDISNHSVEKYITGDWLEEFIYHAVLEAGADAALSGVALQWRKKQYGGESEVDVIARKGDALLFVSCKKTHPDFLVAGPGVTGKKKQNRRKMLLGHLHEADNIPDHLGVGADKVALVLTSDLIDEAQNNAPRYEKLFALAEALCVEILPLEDLAWPRAVERLRKILEDM